MSEENQEPVVAPGPTEPDADTLKAALAHLKGDFIALNNTCAELQRENAALIEKGSQVLDREYRYALIMKCYEDEIDSFVGKCRRGEATEIELRKQLTSQLGELTNMNLRLQKLLVAKEVYGFEDEEKNAEVIRRIKQKGMPVDESPVETASPNP